VGLYHPRRDSYEPEEKPAKLRLRLAPTPTEPDRNPDRRPSDSRFVLGPRSVLLEVRGLGVVMIDFSDQMLIFTEDEIWFDQSCERDVP
jgi:hypothetical protein